MSEFKFKLKEQVIDEITGFSGRVIARIENFEGNTYLVQGKRAAFDSFPKPIQIEECRLRAAGHDVPVYDGNDIPVYEMPDLPMPENRIQNTG